MVIWLALDNKLGKIVKNISEKSIKKSRYTMNIAALNYVGPAAQITFIAIDCTSSWHQKIT
jgi:hypothetical protein